ncbi:FUSC family protein [Tamlana sp. 2_MG-2023]|uniref:FUSC family protein n=1 Tax=unclassified Tamlana TaxID=2614803 RepID=UPI0026E20F40|nr:MULTISPECIES: FUSC family protein [unclassified Tamlana]MDO6759221.1 FUSC family protein [Tamlana sp. 2_MG-2023]MDO6790640.1 FUSC family protein [Tamlana sp. 1_MG-2023]
MKKTSTILSFIMAVLASILAVLPSSNFAIYPALAALIFGFIAFTLSKKTGEVKKIIQFSILLSLLALGLSAYKSFFIHPEVTNTESIETTKPEPKEAPIKEK